MSLMEGKMGELLGPMHVPMIQRAELEKKWVEWRERGGTGRGGQ